MRRCDFEQFVHRQNYLCRDVQQVYTHAYLQDWYSPAEGALPRRFFLPVVDLRDNCIKFINGRHRTAVLAAHLDLLPMALAQPLDGAAPPLFERIRYSDLALHTVISLPDLPMLTHEQLERFIDRTVPRIPTPDPW
ncbi:MAG: hypothetical protein IT483_15810 [Gammaproteobacteria bacterium]|nr:hypothetical protein [Gammaproteobacteria bacterium]